MRGAPAAAAAAAAAACTMLRPNEHHASRAACDSLRPVKSEDMGWRRAGDVFPMCIIYFIYRPPRCCNLQEIADCLESLLQGVTA